jgi:hypothetical protein
MIVIAINRSLYAVTPRYNDLMIYHYAIVPIYCDRMGRSGVLGMIYSDLLVRSEISCLDIVIVAKICDFRHDRCNFPRAVGTIDRWSDPHT